MADLVVCSASEEDLLSVELRRDDTVVWAAMASGDAGLRLDDPVAIAGLESSALYDVTGPLPAGELQDVVVIRGTNSQLTVVIADGFGGFPSADDLDCAR